MPDRYPTVLRGQGLHEPFLTTLDDYLVEYLPNEAALNAWTARRAATGRPVPNGKIVLVLDDFQFRHRNGAAWIKKIRPPNHQLRTHPGGRNPPRPHHLDWSRLPIAVHADQWTTAGYLANHNWPFTTTTPTSLTFEVTGPHQNHMAAQIAAPITLNVQTDFDLEVICVGAGGPGQDWHANWFHGDGVTTSTTIGLFGGAGGGAGAVTITQLRVLAGDQLTTQIGRSAAPGNTYDLAATILYRNGSPVLFAPGGQPYLQGTTWTNRNDAYDPDGSQRITGSAAGTPAFVRTSPPGFLTFPGNRYQPPLNTFLFIPLRVNSGSGSWLLVSGFPGSSLAGAGRPRRRSCRGPQRTTPRHGHPHTRLRAWRPGSCSAVQPRRPRSAGPLVDHPPCLRPGRPSRIRHRPR